MSRTAHELRQLAKDIEDVCQESLCMSLAYPIVAHCAEHLRLLAGFHEQQQRDAALQAQLKT